MSEIFEEVINVQTQLCYGYRCQSQDYDEVLVESIKQHGMIHPLLARKTIYGYEVFIGIKRLKIALFLHLSSIPVIIRDMSDNEIELIRFESKISRKGVESFKYSEMAQMVYQYHTRIKAQGKRTDLLNEVRNILEEMESVSTSCPLGEKLDSGRDSGKKFNMSSRSISRYLRVYQLISSLKSKLDCDVISLRTAVELSYLNVSIQEYIANGIEQHNWHVSYEKAMVWTEKHRTVGLQEQDIQRSFLLSDKAFGVNKGFRKMSGIFCKYGMEAYANSEVEHIVDEALALYFKDKQRVLWQ